ncbi:MAG TPA: hypothetical protein VHT91_04930 [Kofleriaceae bacterium]|jgi:hypothetical protein|nr:hypothetical protein [Kofleriaceae bacterium]
MRTVSQLALVIAAIGCGGSQPLPRTELHGYAARMEAADRDDQLADAHHRAAGPPDTLVNPDNYQCGDVDLDEQVTSGGKPLVKFGANSVPCWNPAEENAQRRRVTAERLHRRARDERHAAASLVEAETAACRGISPAEIEHSPFAHRQEIAEIIPHRERGKIRGVRIVFRPVLGLSPAWMEQAIACHRARFERLGETPTYLTDDPTLVAGAVTTVSLHRGHLEVLVETRDDVAAHVALGRAQDLVRPWTQTAAR